MTTLVPRGERRGVSSDRVNGGTCFSRRSLAGLLEFFGLFAEPAVIDPMRDYSMQHQIALALPADV